MSNFNVRDMSEEELEELLAGGVGSARSNAIMVELARRDQKKSRGLTTKQHKEGIGKLGTNKKIMIASLIVGILILISNLYRIFLG